jgi:hypothetical protein
MDMGMDVHRGHALAEWMDMGTEMDIDYQWNSALGRNYGHEFDMDMQHTVGVPYHGGGRRK